MPTDEPTKQATKDDEPQTTATIRLPKALWNKLRGRAGLQGKSANEYVRELIERDVNPSH